MGDFIREFWDSQAGRYKGSSKALRGCGFATKHDREAIMKHAIKK